MFFIYFASLISGLPMLYPISKFIRKMDITLFDLLMLFSGIYFVIIPLTSFEYYDWTSPSTSDVFWMYTFFSYSLFLLSIYWDRKSSNRNSLINITSYMGNISDIKISSWGYVFLFSLLVVLFTMYVSKVSLTSRDTEEMFQRNNNYVAKSFMSILSVTYVFLGCILNITFAVNLRNKKQNIFVVVLLLAFYAMSIFLRRRVFLFQLVTLFIAIYSCKKSIVNTKFAASAIAMSIMLYVFYFPFFNVIRNNNVIFDSSKPISSFVGIINYGIDNWGKKSERAHETTDSRSINVYDAVLNLAKACNSPMYGELTYMEIDVAIPKVINPNKGNGTEGILQRMSGQNHDIADSFFLLSYGEFLSVGGFYALLLYFVVFSLYSSIANLALFYNCRLITLFVAIQLISYCWNIEGKLGSTISWFSSSIIVLFIFVVIERCRIISVGFYPLQQSK